MESIALKALWLFIHLIFDIIEAIYYFGQELREKIYCFIKNIGKDSQRNSKKHEIVFIETNISNLKKLPKHIGVILNLNNEKDVDLSKLANLVSWSLNSGVHFISFYDYKGILKHQLASSFHKTIQEQVDISDNENIVWGPNYEKHYNSLSPSSEGIKFPHRNGYNRHIIINLYSSHDSYGTFHQLLTDEFFINKTIANDEREICRSREITIETVDEKLNKLYGILPEPEIAIYFGNNNCTGGFLPWHSRLTEFIQISYKLHQLSLEKYLRVLYKYARCEQRYGK